MENIIMPRYSLWLEEAYCSQFVFLSVCVCVCVCVYKIQAYVLWIC